MSPIGRYDNSAQQSGVSGMNRMTADMPPFQPDDIRAMARRQVETAMEQIQSVNTIIDNIATQFPAASPEIRAIKEGMVRVMGKIVGSQAQPESQVRTGVMG